MLTAVFDDDQAKDREIRGERAEIRFGAPKVNKSRFRNSNPELQTLRAIRYSHVEGLADLLWRLALDHVRHTLTGHVQQTLDIQVVRGLEGEGTGGD